MMSVVRWTAAMMIVIAPVANAAEPGAAPVPSGVTALKGCWQGTGVVMDKPVAIALSANSIVDGGMFAVDVMSSAVADANDRYSAHLLFGGTEARPRVAPGQIVGYWADSFGGSGTANGHGVSRPDGFDITYDYPDATFINRWRVTPTKLTWQIVDRHKAGAEKPFASYSLARTSCVTATGS